MQGNRTLASMDVSDGVRASIEGNLPALNARAPGQGSARPVKRLPGWRWSVAASVVAALVVGFGAGAGWESSDGELSLMAGSSAAASAAGVPEVALQGLNEAQREHLSRYLLEHAQHSSLGAGGGSVGYARLASVSGPSGPGY